MGASGKPDSDYRLSDHIAHVDGLVAALRLSEVVLVGHDWGAAIALDLLRRGVVDVRGVAVMEAHLRPLPDWDALDEGGRSLFQRLRQPDIGEQMVLDDNFFLDILLPAGLTAELPDDELEVYRAPYPDPPSRRPLLQWAGKSPSTATLSSRPHSWPPQRTTWPPWLCPSSSSSATPASSSHAQGDHRGYA